MDAELDSLLARWEERREQGEELSAEALCARCPDRLDEVRWHLGQLHALERVLDVEGLDSLDNAATAPATSLSAEATYRVLRPHARGGLGEVMLARDEGLGREVAVKRMQASHDGDPARRARFLREAEITGQLEHPGIVPLYGAGRDAEGRPFYAMRFVRGESLQEAINRHHQAAGAADPGERRLQLAGLLRRFLDVCHAVAFAHSRGIIHRDLKPSNIMLGPYNETLVVDWGLAKHVDSGDGPVIEAGDANGDDSATRIGAALGTPGYMSPEQAEGRWDLVGPSGDVYSLGATLYVLLTGRSPFPGKDAAELLDRVRRGDFPPPRRVNPSVPAPLEAICLKAMALRPEQRYESAETLASDLERWLADAPVSAYRDPMLTRLGRWVRRHRLLVAGLSVALIVAVVALAVGNVLIGQQRSAALAQRDRAEANLDQARRVVEQMYAEVAADLEERPGMDAHRRELLQKALRFYEDFALPQSGARSVRFEAGRAALRVATIQAQLGRKAEAERAYRRALAAFETLTREDPADPEPRRALADASRGLAWTTLNLGRPAEARPLFRRAVDERQALVRDFAQADDRKELIRDLTDLGLREAFGGRQNEAEADLRRAVSSGEAQVAEDPRAIGPRRELGWAYQSLGYFYNHDHRTDRRADALAALRRSVALWEGLVGEQPGALRIREGFGFALAELADAHTRAARWPESEAAHRRALAIREAISAEHPGVFSFADMHSLSLALVGNACRLDGRLADAERFLERSIAVRERLIREAPEKYFQISNLIAALSYHADLLRETGRPSEAAAELTRGIDELHALLLREPGFVDGRAMLSALLRDRSEARTRLGRDAEALADLDAVAADAVDPAFRDEIRALRASALVRLGRPDLAEAEAALVTDRSPTTLYALARYRALRASSADGDAWRAIALLALAARAGYFEGPGRLRAFRDEPDFVMLRSRQDWQDLIHDLSFPADPFAR